MFGVGEGVAGSGDLRFSFLGMGASWHSRRFKALGCVGYSWDNGSY